MKTKIINQIFYEKVSIIKKVISVITAGTLIWFQLIGAVPVNASTPASVPVSGYGATAQEFMLYDDASFAVQGANCITGENTEYIGDYINYVYYIGIDNEKVKVTDYIYTEDDANAIEKIVDCTTGKYIQYGWVYNSNGDKIAWKAIEEYNADGEYISIYRYNDEGNLIRKDLYDDVDKHCYKGEEKYKVWGKTRSRIVDKYQDCPEERDLVGYILYDENENPFEQYTIYEKRDHDGKSDTDDVWLHYEGDGRLSKQWHYDRNSKIDYIKENKWQMIEVGYQRWHRQEYEEITYIDVDSGKAQEVHRKRAGQDKYEVVGSFSYDSEGKMIESTYTDITGLKTTTQYDGKDRPIYALTTGKKNVFIKGVKAEFMFQVDVKTETRWSYNDTDEQIIIDGPDDKQYTVAAGGLVKKETHTHAYGEYNFTERVSKGISKCYVHISGVVDTTTDSTEYYDHGNVACIDSHTDNSKSRSHVSVSKGSSIFSAVLVAIIVIVAVVITAGIGAAAAPGVTAAAGTGTAGMAAGTGLTVGFTATGGVGMASAGTAGATMLGACGSVTVGATSISAAMAQAFIPALVTGLAQGVMTYLDLRELNRTDTFENEATLEHNPANMGYESISLHPPVMPPTKSFSINYNPQAMW